LAAHVVGIGANDDSTATRRWTSVGTNGSLPPAGPRESHSSDLSAQVYGDPPVPMGMNVPGDNRKLALNIVHWLSGLID
jgi:hypothetical protein